MAVDAQKNVGGLSSVHGNLMKLDPLMQQYLEVSKMPTYKNVQRLGMSRHVIVKLEEYGLVNSTTCNLGKLLTGSSALQQMTEAAVTKERAKLYAELKQSIGHQTLTASADELASLRDKYVPALLSHIRFGANFWRSCISELNCCKASTLVTFSCDQELS